MTENAGNLVVATWSHWLTDWSSWLIAASRSPETITLRNYHMRRFAGAHPHLAPGDVEIDAISAWLGSFDWQIETRRSYRASLRVFFHWAHITGRRNTDPAALLAAITPPRAQPRPTPEDVLAAALHSADPRVQLMLELGARAGLRRGEISRVHTDDLVLDDEDGGWNLRVHGKGGKLRVVPLNAALAARLRHLPHGWVFPGQIDGHLSPAHTGKLMSRALPDHWTAHPLRHRFAGRVYEPERDIRAVQELLGHASVATTQIYTPVPQGAMRRAIAAAA